MSFCKLPKLWDHASTGCPMLSITSTPILQLQCPDGHRGPSGLFQCHSMRQPSQHIRLATRSICSATEVLSHEYALPRISSARVRAYSIPILTQ